MMEDRNRLHFGWRIERLAEQWLLERHQRRRIIARNFRCRGGEVDLIVEETGRNGAEIVFVEVRARLAGSWIGGVESVDFAKRRKLVRAIGVFLQRYRGKAVGARVDILGWDGKEWDYRENVWL